MDKYCRACDKDVEETAQECPACGSTLVYRKPESHPVEKEVLPVKKAPVKGKAKK